MKRLLTLMLTAALSLPVWALDEAGQARLHAVQTRWAEIQYQLPEAQREAALEKLAAESAAFTREQPQAAEAWVWHGIVTSSWAGAQGGLGALGKAKDAKAYLRRPLPSIRARCRGRPIPAWAPCMTAYRAGRSASATKTRPTSCCVRRCRSIPRGSTACTSGVTICCARGIMLRPRQPWRRPGRPRRDRVASWPTAAGRARSTSCCWK